MTLSLLLLPCIRAQRVAVYQSGSYYPGLVSVRDFATAPPGLYFTDYNYFIFTSDYYDRNGDKFSRGPVDIPDLGTIDLSYDGQINSYLNVPVIFYASSFKILGAQYLASVVPIYLSAQYDVFLSADGPGENISGSESGWGDLSVMPFGLAWSIGKRAEIGLTYTAYLPTGRFELGADDNLGQGYWTHQIQLPVYVYAMNQATAFLLASTIEFNGQINDTDFRAGNRFSLEYGISQYLTDRLEIGVLNAHNWQISDDKGEEVWWRNSRFDSRDRKNTFGFGVGYWVWEERLNFKIRGVVDYGIRQRFKNTGISFTVLFDPRLL